MVPTIATVIVAATLILIFMEKIHRTITALFGAMVMLAAGLFLDFYSEEEAIHSIEWDAMALLVGMMILVSILEPTGFFQYLAIKAGQLSKGQPWRLMVMLGGGTALISLFFNNVTTVVLIGPVTILISELLGFSPIPFLMAMAFLSDTADVGTSIGDPASVLVASASGYSFTDFLTHAMPIVIVAVSMTLLMLRYLFSDELAKKPSNLEALFKLDAEEALHDRKTALRLLSILVAAILLFLFQTQLNISSGFIALCAASIALLWLQPDVRETLLRVDWPVLLFFIGLFILVGGLEASGAFEPFTNLLADLGRRSPLVLGVAILWIVAIASALVDNVPITIAMISVLQGLAAAGVDVSALWWAVVLGAGFGGDATPIGTGANIVIVSLSERSQNPITPALWARKGLPVALINVSLGSVLFALAYPWLGR